ncbi:hypothetical protein Tco_1577109 [Tanacetum coccineum]
MAILDKSSLESIRIRLGSPRFCTIEQIIQLIKNNFNFLLTLRIIPTPLKVFGIKLLSIFVKTQKIVPSAPLHSWPSFHIQPNNKLHDAIYENAKLRAQLFDKVFEQKDTSKGTSMNTKFANQSTKRKPLLQSVRNQFVVRQPNTFQSERPNFSKTRIPQKVDKSNDLSNPVTSNSVPTTNESKVVDNDKVIALGMFRINPFKNSREEKLVPNKPTKASVRTNPITVSQPHVIIKKVVNSDSNGFSSTGVDITTKTRRPQPRSNTKKDRVPSASKSSRIKNK